MLSSDGLGTLRQTLGGGGVLGAGLAAGAGLDAFREIGAFLTCDVDAHASADTLQPGALSFVLALPVQFPVFLALEGLAVAGVEVSGRGARESVGSVGLR